jgi:predicted  nucleic acid-binding Zn-ribbon protein
MTGNRTTDEHGSGTGEEWQLDVRNVGGIDRLSVSLDPGVTVVAGENASNKSSLLGSLAGVLGGTHPPLRGGCDDGTVTLDTGDERCDLELVRRDGETVVGNAMPYAEASTIVDLFVALGEENPIRRAVVDDGDLHDLLMRPVDTDEIDAEIERLRARRAEIDERLAALDDRIDDLPELEVRAARLREKRDEISGRLDERRAAIEEADYREATEATRALLDDLRDARSERERLRERRETKRRAAESLREDLAAVEERLAASAPDGAESVDARLDEIEADLRRLRDRKGRIDETINALSPIVELNQGVLADERRPSGFGAADVVSALDPDSESVTCWTCGQSAERAELDEKREERADLETRQRDLEREIEERERSLADLDARLAEVSDRIERLETELETTDAAGDLIDRHRAVSDLEYERGRLERELADVEADIEAAEAAQAERESLREKRREVTNELAACRQRVDRIEHETVETVNDCLMRVLDRLAYRGIERVWIERREEGAETVFDLHIVRTADDGTVYRAPVDTLSKSEREVVGLVIALAGYLVYDVAETVPAVVVDAIEMLDAARIGGLLDFFADHARYVVAAVLPEEAERLRERFETVAPTADIGAS